MTWDRIETMGRSLDLEEGVRARIADPMWLLGRQWQVGEFRGDDASQPVSVSVKAEIVPIGSYRSGPSGKGISLKPQPGVPPLPPLEVIAEAELPEENGFTGVAHAARIGQELARAFADKGLPDLEQALRRYFGFRGLAEGLAGSGRSRAALRVLQNRGIDGRRLVLAKRGLLDKVILQLGPEDQATAEEVLKIWQGRHQQSVSPSWDAAQFEHRFSLSAMAANGEVVLSAPGHRGGHLDWYQFDIGGASHRLNEAHPDHQKEYIRHALPTPVRYSGMPAARWWEVEDHKVHMGDIQSGPGDFARLMVAEFATSYSDDWFIVPLRVPRGSLVQVKSVMVHDNFDSTPKAVFHVSQTDNAALSKAGSGAQRGFRLFELSNDPEPDAGRAPWLFVPATLASSMEGPTLELVELARDEGANLAWAIERIVEGPLGRAFDRGREWFASDAGQPFVPPSAKNGVYEDQTWSYHLHSEAPPPWWIPFLPENIDGGADIRLRRGQMQQWQALDPDVVGVQGSFLAPRGTPYYIAEEEVPRSGVTLRRNWQFTRSQDGRAHVWLQNTKSAGRGERASGLRWDILK